MHTTFMKIEILIEVNWHWSGLTPTTGLRDVCSQNKHHGKLKCKAQRLLRAAKQITASAQKLPVKFHYTDC